MPKLFYRIVAIATIMFMVIGMLSSCVVKRYYPKQVIVVCDTVDKDVWFLIKGAMEVPKSRK